MIGLYFFLGQLLEMVGDFLSLPAYAIKSIGAMLIEASGYNELMSEDNGQQGEE